MPEYDRILAAIAREVAPVVGQGRVADYIPPLAAVPQTRFGLALRTVGGEEYSVGDAEERFSIQSIAKVLSLALCLRTAGDDLWERVGREPSGSAFNSLIQLESENGMPRNPLINAGALVVLDAILAGHPDADDALLAFVREAAGTDAIGYDLAVADGERATGYRNRALAYFLKSYGTLRGDPEAVLDAYFRLCSIAMTCRELCAAFTFLATGGIAPTGGRVVSARQAKRLNAVMLTCGVYDEAGDYAFRVGLPAKSGVGGGVVAVLPGEYVAAVWSPGLNDKGNSLAGTMALELLTTMTGRSIF